jgi:hypothetical protein
MRLMRHCQMATDFRYLLEYIERSTRHRPSCTSDQSEMTKFPCCSGFTGAFWPLGLDVLMILHGGHRVSSHAVVQIFYGHYPAHGI